MELAQDVLEEAQEALKGLHAAKSRSIYEAEYDVFNLVSKVLYTFTWSKRFLAGSILKMTNNQITPRLIWVLRNIPGILEDLKVNDVAFGTIDTWLLNKLTDGVLHITDVSNASSTGLFDPFTLSWAKWAFQMFNIPRQIFPEVVDNAGLHFGCVSEKIFGEPITIYCCMADQSASMFGFCCFHTGDIKVTMGTGTFLDVNTGNKPHASFYGNTAGVEYEFHKYFIKRSMLTDWSDNIVHKTWKSVGINV